MIEILTVQVLAPLLRRSWFCFFYLLFCSLLIRFLYFSREKLVNILSCTHVVALIKEKRREAVRDSLN